MGTACVRVPCFVCTLLPWFLGMPSLLVSAAPRRACIWARFAWLWGWHGVCKRPPWEVLTVEDHEQSIDVLSRALGQSWARIAALEKELRYVREQYAVLEGCYNALLEKVAAVPPAPS
jgi:hypothetical protein